MSRNPSIGLLLPPGPAPRRLTPHPTAMAVAVDTRPAGVAPRTPEEQQRRLLMLLLMNSAGPLKTYGTLGR